MKVDVAVNPVRRSQDAWVPVLIVIVVLGLVHDSRTGRTPNGVAIFSRSEAAIDRGDFHSADLVALFGSSHLDTRHASFEAGPPSVNAVALFGQVEVVVPRGTRVVGNRLPLLGSVRVRTSGSDSGPEIRVDAVAIFGSIVIHD
jgi:hypothetical protein